MTSVSGRAAFYAVKPVTYETYGAGVVGYLAMLRFIDGTAITHWEGLVGGALEVVPRQSASSQDIQNNSNEIEAMRVGLDGPDGRPAFWLKIEIDDDSFQAARASLRTTMNYTLIIGAVTFFVLLIGFQQLVFRPISRLTREVLSLMPDDRSYSMKRLVVRGQDEPGVIASEINGLLERLERVASESEVSGPASGNMRETPGS